MIDLNLIWQWATATLSPASVILFMVAISAAFGAWWFLKELRKADLRLLELTQKTLAQVREELGVVKSNHREDLNKLYEMRLKQNKLEFDLQTAQMEINNLKDLLTQANATIATLLQSKV